MLLFFFMVEYYSTVFTCHVFILHPCVDGHLGCFHLALVNRAAKKMNVNLSL